MTALPQGTRRKLSLLKLAEELGNVSRACRIMGYHRDTFYEIKRAFQVGGVHALVEQKRGPRGPHPNRVSPEIEAAILHTRSIIRPGASSASRTSSGSKATRSARAACEGCG